MRFFVIITFLLAGCATFPELDGTISDELLNAPYPVLTPVPLGPAANPEDAAEMTARVAALQARAERIRQIDIGALQ